MGNEDLEKLEDLVSNTIQKSLPVVRKTLPLNEALKIDGVVSLENEVSIFSVFLGTSCTGLEMTKALLV